uniref:Lysozyme n=1 Tax=Ditylenchus dipsaci TaxID=166011 RepID=A0A915E854_9BILA
MIRVKVLLLFQAVVVVISLSEKNGKCSIQGCGTNLCGKLMASNAKRHLSTCHSDLPIFNISAHRLSNWYASTTSMPLLHVENEYLKALLSLIPGFKPPGSTALRRRIGIGTEFAQVMSRVYESVQASSGIFSISADIATTKGLRQSFIGIAVHYWCDDCSTFKVADLVEMEGMHSRTTFKATGYTSAGAS